MLADLVGQSARVPVLAIHTATLALDAFPLESDSFVAADCGRVEVEDPELDPVQTGSPALQLSSSTDCTAGCRVSASTPPRAVPPRTSTPKPSFKEGPPRSPGPVWRWIAAGRLEYAAADGDHDPEGDHDLDRIPRQAADQDALARAGDARSAALRGRRGWARTSPHGLALDRRGAAEVSAYATGRSEIMLPARCPRTAPRPLGSRRRCSRRSRSRAFHPLVGLERHLEPSYEALLEDVLSARVVGADETTWRLMGKKKAKRFWVWTVTREDAVGYRILPSRSADAAREVLGDFRGPRPRP